MKYMFQKIGITTPIFTLVSALLLSSDLMADSLEEKISQNQFQKERCGAWAAGFVSEKTHDGDCNTAGYKLLTGGGIMGLEWQVCPQSHKAQIGIAVRYDNSDLDGNHDLCEVPGNDLDFDSMRAIIYSRWFYDPVYLTGMVSFAFNQYFWYQNLGGHPHGKQFGDYDGRQWSGQLELGYEWKSAVCGVEITPQVSLYYSNLNTDCYKQIRADGLNNQEVIWIDGQSDEALLAAFDLSLAYVNHYPKAKVIPYIHAKAQHQALDGSLQNFTATNAFGEGTAYIYSNDPPNPTSYQVGGGIKVIGDHAVVVVMSYNYSFKPGDHVHDLLLYIKHDW